MHERDDHPDLDAAFLAASTPLRAIAASLMRGERPDHTLQATAIVNEAYLRLLASPPREVRDEGHFLAIAATTLRRVLVDHGRRRRPDRRGAEAIAETRPSPDLAASIEHLDLLSESAACMERLAVESPRSARVLELRTLAGLGIDEVAALLNVSRTTVERDWRYARAWLADALAEDRPSR